MIISESFDNVNHFLKNYDFIFLKNYDLNNKKIRKRTFYQVLFHYNSSIL